MGQHFLRKSVLNPSGHGALSEGKCLTTESTSSFEKGVTREERSWPACINVGKLKFIPWKEETPNLSLKSYPDQLSFGIVLSDRIGIRIFKRNN